ncbi:MAG: class I SAM-dependent methyltransferase [Planctomycetota bacterium]
MAEQRNEYRGLTEFYDAEYADQQFLKEDFGMMLAEIGEAKRVVEIGCGTGRAALPIAQSGHDVVGFDVDVNMLKLAEATRDKAGVSPDTLRYVHADATEATWPTQTGGDFDVACCFFNTLLAFAQPEHQEACLLGAAGALRPGGMLWLDLFNPDLNLITSAAGGIDELEPSLFHLPDGRSVQRTTSLYANITEQIQHVTFHYKWFEDDNVRTADCSFDMTWITHRELSRLLRLCGFEIIDAWGDYEHAPLDDDAPRQIVMARKV